MTPVNAFASSWCGPYLLYCVAEVPELEGCDRSQ
jgi:hypothetical protein